MREKVREYNRVRECVYLCRARSHPSLESNYIGAAVYLYPKSPYSDE